MGQNQEFLFIWSMLLYPPSPLMTPVPVYKFPNDDEPKVLNNIARDPVSCFFTSCFTDSLPQSINTSEFYSDVLTLTISSKSTSSFEMTELIIFYALTILLLIFFLWVASSIAEVDTREANGAHRVLTRGTETFNNGPENFPNITIFLT